ncbi:MAG: hypothetical protein ACOH5I_26460 [Oligoflexus sp.]
MKGNSMHECPKCGYSKHQEEAENYDAEQDSLGSDDADIKMELLEELMGVLEGGLASKLSKKKPDAVSVEILEVAPKKKSLDDDEEDEEEY